MTDTESTSADAASSVFAHVQQPPDDPMFALSASFRADASPDKVDLGVGAYRDEQGRAWVLPSVRQAEEKIASQLDRDHEYLPIAGHAAFLEASAVLIFGADSPVLKQKRVATVQTLSGTGALHLGAALLAQFLPAADTIYMSSPPYVNHAPIFGHVGIAEGRYPYYLEATRGFDRHGMLAQLESIPNGSLILLHACGHNPTGVDPSEEDWRCISQTMKRKRHIPFFDIAYQGFASGDVDADAWPIRHFVAAGFGDMLVAQSYAKNMGLYGERVGCLHVCTGTTQAASHVLGQLKLIQRREVSTPPLHGARVAATVFTDPAILQQWKRDVAHIAQRLRSMRQTLKAHLEALGEQPLSWQHLTDQVGMFCYTGLSLAQVMALREKHHVYLSKDGRISVAGLNEGNVERTARAIVSVRRIGSML